MSNAASTTHRAGRYAAQPSGYRAFMPAPLPPDMGTSGKRLI